MTREEAIEILEIKRECMDYEGFSCAMDLKTKIDGTDGCYLCEKAIDMAIEALRERPKGRWIRYKYSHKLGECSLCGEIVAIRSNYCPNCGADMREIENE